MKILFTVFFDPYDLGSRQLAAYMQSRGHEVLIVDLKVSNWAGTVARPSPEDIQNCGLIIEGYAARSFTSEHPITDKELELLTRLIAEWKPDIVGYGTRTKNHGVLHRVIPAIRAAAPHALLLAGGIGPTLDPAFSLELGVDAVIKGEGEYPLEQLVNAYAAGEDWRHAPNLVYLDQGKMISTPMLPLERDLDKFPLPLSDPRALVMIDNDRYYRSDEISGDERIFSNSTKGFHLATRGCCADCSYCGGRVIRGVYTNEGLKAPRVRAHSLDYVLDEAKRSRDEGKELIYWCDEFFIYPIKDLIRFFQRYKQEVDLPFFANLSADQIALSQEMLHAAFEAGWYEYSFGLQTGNETFCLDVYNRKNNNEHIVRAVHMCTELGMSGFFYMIAGNPLEGEAELGDTHSLLARLPAFDPSLRTIIHFKTSKFFMPPGDVPIKARFPDLGQKLCDHNTYYRQAMLIALRTVLDDEEFYLAKNYDGFVEKPHLLGGLYHDSIQSKHTAYVQKGLEDLQGREVLFWGCGNAYRAKRGHLAGHVKPRAIIVDEKFKTTDSLDGLPVLTPSQAGELLKLPLVVFAGKRAVGASVRRIRSLGIQSDILTCTDQFVPQ